MIGISNRWEVFVHRWNSTILVGQFIYFKIRLRIIFSMIVQDVDMFSTTTTTTMGKLVTTLQLRRTSHKMPVTPSWQHLTLDIQLEISIGIQLHLFLEWKPKPRPKNSDSGLQNMRGICAKHEYFWISWLCILYKYAYSTIPWLCIFQKYAYSSITRLWILTNMHIAKIMWLWLWILKIVIFIVT